MSSSGGQGLVARGPVHGIDQELFPGAAIIAVDGGCNGLVGYTVNDLPAGSASYPTGTTGYGRNDGAGNQAFGLFGRADAYAAGVATNELDSFNYNAAPSGTYPPDRSFGTADTLPIGVTVAAGGTLPSAIGVHICREGSAPQQFLTGVYVDPTTVRDYPLYIDGGAANYPSLILGAGTLRGLGNAAAAFGVHLTDDATGALLLVGAVNGNTPYLAAGLSQGVATPLAFYTNNALAGQFNPTGELNLTGGATPALQVNGRAVVHARRTGWAQATGTANRATWDTGSVTVTILGETLKALIDDLFAHGLIGA